MGMRKKGCTCSLSALRALRRKCALTPAAKVRPNRLVDQAERCMVA